MSIHLNQSPRSITEFSQNESNSVGHTHAIDKASVKQAGIVKLVDSLDSKSKTEALTANQGRELAERLSLLAQSNGSKEINHRLESALSYLATRYTAAYATYETAKDNLCKHPENSLIYVVNDPTKESNGLWTVVGGKLVKAPWDTLSSALTSEAFETFQSILQGAAGEKIEYRGKTYYTLATLNQTLEEGKNYIQDVLIDLAQSNNFTASYLLTKSGKFQEEVNSDVQESLGNIYKHGAALPYKDGIDYEENAVVVKDGVLQQWKGGEWEVVSTQELKDYLLAVGIGEAELGIEYNYIMQRLAQIAVDKGWDASFVVDASGKNQQEINDSLVRIVSNKTDLLTINNPRNNQVVYVLENEKRYIYNSTLTDTDNGVTVIGKWEMELQDSYYASWFATPDVQSDQKAALAVGYAYATLKKRPFIIDGKYWVNLTTASQVGMSVLSDSKLIFIRGKGSLNALPTSSTNYQILTTYQASNYEVWDAELNGDRLNHIGTTGEWGHGLAVWDGADGYIHRPVIKNCWGDGIDIGRRATTAPSSEPTRVTIFEPYIERCRRNGISPRSSDTCRIIRPIIRYIGDSDGIAGTWPKAGIDIEPNDATGTNDKPYHRDLVIDSPTVENCFSALYVPNHFANKIEVRITGTSRFHANSTVVMGFWNRHVASEGFVDIDRVIVSGHVYTGIQCALVAASKFYVRVGEIVLDKSIAGNFTVSGSYNGFAGTEGELGNADFTFTIPDNVYVLRTIGASDKPYTIGMKLSATPNSENKPSIYAEISNANDFPKLGKHFYVDGISTRDDSSASFSRRYGSVIKLRTNTDKAIRAIATNDDFSEKTVIYDPLSAVTTYGIRVNNLMLTIGGVAKTSALTTELGASITFRNVPGGQTQIISMTGSWTFS